MATTGGARRVLVRPVNDSVLTPELVAPSAGQRDQCVGSGTRPKKMTKMAPWRHGGAEEIKVVLIHEPPRLSPETARVMLRILLRADEQQIGDSHYPTPTRIH